MKLWLAVRRFHYLSIMHLDHFIRTDISMELVGKCSLTLLNSRTSFNLCFFIGELKFPVQNHPFSTLSHFVNDQLLTHLSLASSGPTRHRDFIENANRLVFCTRATINTMTELTVLPRSCNWVFDLELNRIHKSGKGPIAHWNIWLRLD